MKRFLLGVFAVFMAVTLAGCLGDPVKSDLEDYRKNNNLIQGKLEKEIEAQFRKMNTIQEPKDAIVIIEAVKKSLVEAQKNQTTFQPKSEEMKKLNGRVQTGYAGMVTGVDKMLEAAKADDVDSLNKGIDEMNKHIDDLNKVQNEIYRLAREKKLNWIQQ